jgi:hypothetical protein
MTLEKGTDHLWENGQYYGYPQCCIDNFIEIYREIKRRTNEQDRVHLFSGFVPCHKHALEILCGHTTLEALILPTRKHFKSLKVYREKARSGMTKQ